MSNYRPICDVWLLGRPKVKYYGAYPNGFLERAKPLLGSSGIACLHVCGGRAKDYPNKKFMGPKDYTLDLDPHLEPDFLQNAMDPLPELSNGWPSMILDPPYTAIDADKYAPGASVLPSVTPLLRHSLKYVAVGGRVGVLHYLLPRPPCHGVRFVACVGVIVGYDNRMRCFSVFERII